MVCGAGRSRGLIRQFTCVTNISRTNHSSARSVATPAKRRRAPIIISESLARSNGRYKSRAAGEDSGRRSEVRGQIVGSSFWRDAKTSTRDARATQSEEVRSQVQLRNEVRNRGDSWVAIQNVPLTV